MCEVIKEIEKDSSRLDEIYKEAASYGVEDSLREIWLMDKQRREFMKDQIKNGIILYSYILNLVNFVINTILLMQILFDVVTAGIW